LKKSYLSKIGPEKRKTASNWNQKKEKQLEAKTGKKVKRTEIGAKKQKTVRIKILVLKKTVRIKILILNKV